MEGQNRAARRDRRSPQERRYIGIPGAATYADVGEKTIRRRIADGTLPAVRVGRLIKIRIDDLDKLLKPVGGADA